uniref:GTP-binding protein ryh1 n=1 Tax=Ascaris suum TaxID=6253 RepID=F1L6W2_ASCSU
MIDDLPTPCSPRKTSLSSMSENGECLMKKSSLELTKYKIVFLGEQGVGKSSIITKFLRNEVAEDYIATIGIDFFSKNIVVEGKTVRLQIWDTAGQERFRSLIPSYLRDSDVAVIVYDVSSPTSFAKTRQWFNYVNRQRAGDIAIILVGNKSDLTDKRKISYESGERIAAAWNCRHMDVSALTGRNIQELFVFIAGTLAHEKKSYAECDRIQLAYDEKRHRKSVCMC